MFFTPGRILGILAFIVVMLAIGAALKWLDGLIGFQEQPAEELAEGFAAPLAATPPRTAPKRTKRSRRR